MQMIRWTTLMEKFGLSENTDTHAALIKAYSEKHRAYHTMEHITACLTHLDDVQSLADYPQEIEMALWFHDAVYNPFSSTNEEDSAEWARKFLTENGLSTNQIERIVDLILITKEHIAANTTDQRLMLDIDLSILGSPQHIYDQFEVNVRKEYKRVPKFIFRKKRKEILEKFLANAPVFKMDYFHAKFETQAIVNLKRAITALS